MEKFTNDIAMTCFKPAKENAKKPNAKNNKKRNKTSELAINRLMLLFCAAIAAILGLVYSIFKNKK